MEARGGEGGGEGGRRKGMDVNGALGEFGGPKQRFGEKCKFLPKGERGDTVTETAQAIMVWRFFCFEKWRAVQRPPSIIL